MKEMLGGCCVCSDDRGWTENPLVYCDGQGCTVAVHQACYGIVTVPSGPWFCRKCESQERAARVRCELCPSKDGALKRTDNQGWAHVVCALYIPEVRFGNVSTMEPIILSMVPSERFNKICYICESQGKESKAKAGACMNCNKSGCKYHFHVTCAQAMGLLCEEAGSYVDNVKYCGYCQHHYSKLKKGGNLKTIPAYKPLPAQGTLDSAQEKSNFHGNANWGGHQSSSGLNGNKEKNRKKPSRKSSSGSQVSPKAGNARDSANSSLTTETAETDDLKKSYKLEAAQFTDVLAGVGLMPGPKASVSEASIIVQTDVQDLNGLSKSQEHAVSSDTGMSLEAKKNEKLNDFAKIGVHTHSDTTAVVTDKMRPAKRKSSTRSVSPNILVPNDTESTLSNVSDYRHSIVSEGTIPGEQKSRDRLAVSESCSTVVQSVIVSSNALHHSENMQQYTKNITTPQRSVSPLTITGIQSAGSNSKKLQIEQSRSCYSNICSGSEKDSESLSANKKARRGRAPKLNTPLAPDSPPSSPDSGTGGEQPAKRRKKDPRNSATLHIDSHQTHSVLSTQTEKNSENEQPTFPIPSDHQKIKEVFHQNGQVLDHHVTSTSSETLTQHSLSLSIASSDLSSAFTMNSSSGQDASKLMKQPSMKYNGIIAPHMLGNQINPSSNVAQKMTDTLTAELEAHNISRESPSCSKPIVGVPFPPRPSSSSSNSYSAHSLEQLLERQWEQSSQFLMEQAQHFDIATLLSHLHSLQLENRKLEDRVANLTKRREHLLSVKARLSIPLSMNAINILPTSGSLSDRSPQGPSALSGHLPHTSIHDRDRGRVLSHMLPFENGVGAAEHNPPYLAAGFSSPHGQRTAKDSTGAHQNDRVIPSPVIVSSRGSSMYQTMAPTSIIPPTVSPVQNTPNFLAENRSLRIASSPSSTPELRPEMIRRSSTPSQHPLHAQPYGFPMVSPTLPAPPHHSNPMLSGSLQGAVPPTSQQHNPSTRREVPDSRHTIGKPKSIERR